MSSSTAVDKLAMEFTPSNNIGSPKRQNVRRRLVQSKLFPHKPQEPDDKADEKDETDCCQDERGEEEKLCASEDKKRKSRGKATTPIKGSKRGTQRRNRTPKRNSTPRKNSTPSENASANGLKGSSSQQLLEGFSQTVPAPVPDLRLEAKLSAEENSRIFAGRQIHPLFSSLKVAKKFREPAESEGSLCASERKDGQITCGPIHVYEKTQDNAVPLDWKMWMFLGEATSVNCDPECLIPSVLECSVETINFDKPISNLNLSSASIPQNEAPCSDEVSILPQNLQEISATNSSFIARGGTICFQIPEDAKVDLKVDETDIFSGQAGILGNSDAMPRSRFLEESMRSYYHRYDNKAEGNLWTYKYKPTKAIEVCGNDESVNSLSDWLHQWHERPYRSRKDSSFRDKHDLPDKDDDEDDDYDCSHSDYDSDDINDKDFLQNVLVITGPVGSGKSAAVYACAQEQGFEVLELNASDCRNGTAVKHYFGDTLGSHRFKRLLERTGFSQNNRNMKLPLPPVLPSCKQADELNDGAVEVISISDDQAHSLGGSSQRLLSKKNAFRCDKAQTLILVEDVDVLFPEDRGCIAAIQQISETGKGPIILTSNSNNPILPDNLDRLHVSFSLPSPKELLCHLYMVCVTEGVNVHPVLLEKFIQACDGDIRKTIMHLQFWLHSKIFSKDRIVQTVYGLLPFELEAAHQILPKIIPWAFPSQLSELIEREVSMSVNIMEENFSLQRSVDGELDINEMQNKLDVHHEGTDYIEAKKKELLKRNGSATGCSEFETQFSDIYEFSNSPGISVSFSERNVRRKLVVMSSDSEDETSNNGDLLDVCNATKKAGCLSDNSEFHSEFLLNQNYSRPSFHELVCSGLEDSEKEHHKISITADDTCLNETCQSFDISFVPESSFVPETIINNGTETMSGAVSSGHAAGSLEVSINNELTPYTFNACKSLFRSPPNLDLLGNTEIPESSQKEVVNGFLHENMEVKTVYNLMDECSRVDFHQKSDFVESCLPMETDMVQKLWRKLRDCQTDLRQHATLEQQGALQVVKLANGLSNLISEADLLFHQQKKCGILEPPDLLSDEATFSWCDEQMMMTTVASLGFCFYARHIADVGSKLGCEDRVDLMSEMLTSTTNIMALGKLLRQDLTNGTNIYSGMELNKPRNDLPKSEIKTSLLDVFQSIVPERLFLALRGAASFEYISAMRQISRSEALRLSQGTEMTSRRRGRGALHYLSRGNMMLSPEDISLLCEGELYRKISSTQTSSHN